ncbi:MAG: DUF2911 domain-containing protein [Bacteroidota bacterium]
MKSIFKITALLAFAIILSIDPSVAQERKKGKRPSPNAMVSQDIGATTVSISYGRPGLKGRTLESLTPADKVWRTGANEATTITFSDDVLFGGVEVKAGTYGLYTIPGENWMVMVNTGIGWGAGAYDESTNVAKVQAAVTATDAPNMERFTIYFDTLSDTKAHLNLHWGTTLAAVPITLK